MAISFSPKRALLASPLLLLSVFIFNRMDIEQLASLGPPPATEYTINEFFGISFLDEFFAPITAAFAPSTVGYDPVSWWQMSHFLVDASTLFAICLLEASRGGSWPISVLIVAQLSQIIPMGIFSPIAYFTYLAFFHRSPLPTKRPTYTLLPAIVLLTGHASVLQMYHSPTLESRTNWTWIWQLYPIWTGLLFALSRLSSRLGLFPAGIPQVSLSTTLSVLATLSTLAWWWLLLQTPFTLKEVLLPSWSIESGMDFDDAVRRLLMWDEIGQGAASLFWLGTLCADVLAVRAPGEVVARGLTVLVAAAVGLVILGPGTVFVGLWLWREAMVFGA